METIKKILSKPENFFLFYFIMFIITFGNAYHRSPQIEHKTFAGVEYTVRNEPPFRAFEAMFAAGFWPLYWSVRLQEPK
jgi:hypothetical protein